MISPILLEHAKMEFRTYRSWPPRTVVTCICGRVLADEKGLNAIVSARRSKFLHISHQIDVLAEYHANERVKVVPLDGRVGTLTAEAIREAIENEE